MLLCGLGFHTVEYEPLAESLAASGYNVLSFDYRGHGRSDGPRQMKPCRPRVGRSPDRRSRQRAWLRTDRLFGNSPGATIATQVATADPRVRGVVASNCPAHIADFLLTTPRQMLLTLPRPLQMVPAVRISVDHFYSYEQLINGRASVTRIRTDPTFTAARRLSIGTYRSLLDRNGPGAVHALHRPLLVIQGRTDRLQPAEQSRSSSTPPTTPASTNSLTLATYRTSRTPASALSLDPPMAGLSGRSRIRAKGPLGWDDVGLLHQLFPSHRRHFQ